MSNQQGCQCCGEAQHSCSTEFEYAVKLVCGEVKVNPTGVYPQVAPGRYWTAINIHNPDKCRDAHFRWKVVVAQPLGQPVGVPVFQRPVTLAPDTAVEIDCPQVAQTFPPPPFVKGYVVIDSDNELDVVAVYTGTQGGNTLLSTFHTERVQARCVAACEELFLPLYTGVADWQTISPAPVRPVALVNPLYTSGWTTPPPFGSSWVSEASTDGVPGASTVTRSYQLCFDLCFGFTPPAQIQLQGLADNSATVFLNGQPTGGLTIPGATVPTLLNFSPTLLTPGRNCFQVNVPNIGHGPNPTGFALAGVLHVLGGKCPCAALPIAKPKG